MKPTLIKPLNYTESLLFCLANWLKSVEKLSFYTLELQENSDYFSQQSIETIKKHQQLDRELMQNNLSIIHPELTWYFFYKHFTYLTQLNPTKHGKIAWEALDYDYRNFPDELWKYNSQDSFRLYGIPIKLPSFVVYRDIVYQEKLTTKFIFFEQEMANRCKSYLETKYYRLLDMDVVIEQLGNTLYVPASISLETIPSQWVILAFLRSSGMSKVLLFKTMLLKKDTFEISTFFHPQMLVDYFIDKVDRKLTIGLSTILFLLLVFAFLINLNRE